MLTARKLIALCLFLALAPAGLFAANTTATLFLDSEQARPGDTVMAAVRLQMNPGWHTYWENSGDSGYATKIKWTLPAGVTNGAIQWPVPEKVVISGETTFGYHDEAILLVPLRIAADAPAGPAKFSAKVSWLECEKLCLPGSATVDAELVIGPDHKTSGHTAIFSAARERLPKTSGAAARAYWVDSNPTNRTLAIEWKTSASGADFFPKTVPNLTLSAKSTVGQSAPDTQKILLDVARDDGAWPAEISGVLTENASGSAAVGYAVTLSLGEAVPGAAAATTLPASAPSPLASSLLLQLGLAFFGGLILNIMPCVLPVIALKILGMVGQNRDNPAKVRMHGALYGLGVLASFWVLAAIIIGLKSAGKAAGWGLQFGNPVFIVCLAVIVVLVALNLFGVFEITLSGKLMTGADQLASKQGLGGSFFNGVLATVLGTSCTAPFMGAAVAYALSQGAIVTLLVFSMLALGLASPYLVFCIQPAWLKFLPKPGAWMEQFKIAMGFPIIATGVWLFTLAADRYPDSPAWLGGFFVVLAFAVWIYGEFFQRGRKRRGLALALTLGFTAVGYFYILEKQVNWRNPPKFEASAQTSDGVVKVGKSGLKWYRWSLAAIAKAQAEGRPVLVDFTARWCPNCLANEANGIDVPEVFEKLEAMNAVALRADYDNLPPEMTAEIERHGRAGISLVLVYPGRPGAAPEVLPELFTKGRMLEALARVSGSTTN